MRALSDLLSRSPRLWLFLGLNGRISRRLYWLSYLFLIAADSVLAAQVLSKGEGHIYQLAEFLWPFAVVLTIWSNLAISVKRLHDAGMNGLFAVALFIPLINLAFTIWVGLIPGQSGPNNHGAGLGPPPPPVQR
ncbi:Uncharacterized membrane protein YhaH, DUF805 family [Faunimonas pinastri]|uniref:Uncharacterized membrane protein YhaH, DUF805 family n=1 Tax=Faunimonas pinastri TaxID=1855383 RepID=A0A1H9HFA6_9HYPH|nr:DUF805 domain-containing protein [Faunimonas pinastri]SEQ61010.1 Uncharacterized membrane protein YhaH, DUF805 family [Faunimonas pinastri]